MEELGVMVSALKALGDGNVQGIGENLIATFSAVIFRKVMAFVIFWLASVRKRRLILPAYVKVLGLFVALCSVRLVVMEAVSV